MMPLEQRTRKRSKIEDSVKSLYMQLYVVYEAAYVTYPQLKRYSTFKVNDPKGY